MSILRLFLILFASLILSIPWFFFKINMFHFFGFPPWAFYIFCVTILYAILISLFIGKYWSLNLPDDESEL